MTVNTVCNNIILIDYNHYKNVIPLCGMAYLPFENTHCFVFVGEFFENEKQRKTKTTNKYLYYAPLFNIEIGIKLSF